MLLTLTARGPALFTRIVHVAGSGDVPAGGAAAGMGRGHLSRGSVPALGEALVPCRAGGQHHRTLPVSFTLSV